MHRGRGPRDGGRGKEGERKGMRKELRCVTHILPAPQEACNHYAPQTCTNKKKRKKIEKNKAKLMKIKCIFKSHFHRNPLKEKEGDEAGEERGKEGFREVRCH